MATECCVHVAFVDFYYKILPKHMQNFASIFSSALPNTTLPQK
jgi:hypothetical protein